MVIGIAQAQECNLTLEGKVIDFHDGSPLIDALIKFGDSHKYTVTDLDGKYELKGLCPGTYKVEVSHIQCETGYFEIELKENMQRDFKMEHHVDELAEVTVTGEKYKEETNSGTETTLASKILETYSNASLGDALREVSGVSSLNTGSTVVKPVIQGLHSSRVLIINNGTRMKDQEWGVEHAPNVDVNSAANITVVKGASALKYGGDAVGGVIVMDPPKAPVKDTLFGKTILNGSTNGRGGGVTSSIMKAFKSGWYAKGQGTYKRAGDLESPDYVLSNTGVREQDFSVGFGLNKFIYGFDAFYSFYDAKIGILRASHIGSLSDLVRAINSDEPNYIADFTYDINAPKQDVQHHLAKLSFFKRFEKAGKLSVDYSFQLNNRYEYDIRRGETKDLPSLDLELTTHTLSSDFKWDSHPNFTADFGAESSYQKNFPNPLTQVRRLIPDYEMYTAAGYATLNYDLSDALTLDGGFRYDFVRMDAMKYYLNSRWEERGYGADYSDIIFQEFDNQLLVNPKFDYNNFSGTMGARYTINDQWTALFNLSTASRAPNASELFSDGLHHSAAIIELGDLRLNREQSFKGSLSVEAKGKRYNFSVSPYYNKINDFIILQPTGLQFTNRGAFPVYEYGQVDASLFGIDVQGQYQLNDAFNISSSFAYVHGEDLDEKRPLIDMPAPNWMNTLSYSNLKWNNLTLGLRSQTVFEQTRYPDNDFALEIPDEQGNHELTQINLSKPPAGYTLINLTSAVDFKVSDKSICTLGFYVDNVFNTSYREYLNRQRYFVDDIGRNFRLQIKFNY